MIVPGLLDIEIEDQWEEGEWEKKDTDISSTSDDFGKSPKIRWFAEYSVYLFDKNASPKKFSQNKHAALNLNSYLGLVVCSPEFKANPPGINEEREDLAQATPIRTDHALVQDVFCEKDIKEYLAEKLAQIEAKDVPDLVRQLSQVMIVN